MENWAIEKSDHISWKLYILLRYVCYLRWIRPEVTEILDNMKQKNRNLLANLTKVDILKYESLTKTPISKTAENYWYLTLYG